VPVLLDDIRPGQQWQRAKHEQIPGAMITERNVLESSGGSIHITVPGTWNDGASGHRDVV
jgi:hypothetical protein